MSTTPDGTPSAPLGAGAGSVAVPYARRLGLFSATMMVIGGIIGSGIFRNPAVVAGIVKTPTLVYVAWGLGALIALIGAFIYAELARRRPEAGGGYAYLRDAYGPFPAFMYAWALLLVISTGAISAVAMTFAGYLVSLMGWADSLQPLIAGTSILLLTCVTIFGVRPAAWSQNVFTVLKLTAVAALIVAAFLAPAGIVATAPALGPRAHGLVLTLGAALVPVLFAIGGWQQTNFIAEEMISPERDLPRALIIGVFIVAAAYLLVNVAYLRTLGITGLAATAAPASDAMGIIAGDTGRKLIAAGIVASTFGFLNLVILVTPRVYQAMARDGLFFESFARLHPRWQTPVAAIVLQGVWATVLLLTKSYNQLLDYVVFGDWIFFGLCAAAIFVLRKKDGNRVVQFLTPLHPWSTLIFMASAVYVIVGSIASNPGNAMRGAGLLLIGVPVFLLWRRRAVSS